MPPADAKSCLEANDFALRAQCVALWALFAFWAQCCALWAQCVAFWAQHNAADAGPVFIDLLVVKEEEVEKCFLLWLITTKWHDLITEVYIMDLS